MKAMLKLIAHPWLIRAIGLFALAVVVWLIGPLVAVGEWRPLASVAARAGLIALIAAVWVARRVLAARRAAKAEAGMVGEMTKPAESDGADEEVATIRERFEEALRVLKKARGGHGKLSLYDLPWYVIIGPPGSGKTTALVNSGLRFPLADKFGPNAIRGVGGTRHCDWWFTDEAILIDTAGRYTTQDSHASADRAAWLGFLDLLKKYRRRRPINGVLVALSVADLLLQSESERRAHAAAIKARIAELYEHFGLRFPIYLLLTKCDLVAGFEAFFDDLRRGEREQVWGFTFRYSDAPDADPAAEFGNELDRLLRRLNERTTERVAAEPDPGRRALILGFPKQVAALKPTLGAFVDEVFRASRFESSPLLRGVYFTSGTQEGTPIDRVMGTLARTFRIDADSVAPRQAAGKSYFITDVLRKVAFGEANLAGTNRRLELRRAWLQRGAYAGSAVLVAVLGAAAAFAYFGARAEVGEVSAALERTRELIAEAERGGDDVLAVLPALDAVRALPGGYADRLESNSWLRGFGLSQSGKLGDRAIATYRRLLRELFLPRLMVRLERQLVRGGSTPDYVYEALKAYLMLDSAEHYDPDAIKAFIRADWSTSFGRLAAAERDALNAHLDALFEERPLPLPVPLDADAIATARLEVRRMPLEERIYGRLKRTFDAAIPGFNLRDAAGGATAELVFVRKSGRPLSETLPPLFTRDAYRQVFVDRSRELTTELASEAWVVGEEEALDAAEREALLARVRELYLDEFADVYTTALLDVTLAPFATPEEAARIFNVLSRPEDSPLVLLLEAVARQTALDRSDEDQSLAARAGDRVDQLQQRLQQILGGARSASAATTAESLARNAVETRFGPLNALVTAAEGQPRPVEHLVGLMAELYRYLSVVASEAAGGAIPPHVQQNGQSVLQQLRMEASTQPDLLVGELLEVAASRTTALTTGGLRAYLNELWQSGPLAVCRRAIDGRYPFDRSSERDVQLADFAEFFGYGGTMDAFFNTNLRQYVDATASPWRPRATANLPIRLSDAALRAFENADVIKRTFFRAGSMTPSITFDLRPLEMDPSLSRFLLDLEGSVITYEFGPLVPTLMQWPGPNPGTEVRIELRDLQSGATAMQRLQGPWAWFRLLDRSNLRPTDVPEQFEVTFSQGGRNVLYELTARSAFNPFALPQLEQFRCPSTL